jgi:sugar lactone lactonase YvrE
VWGQSTFSANGSNEVKPGSLNAPFTVAVDYSRQPYALYVSDTANHRILGWKDVVRFRNGDPADMVIGQPDLRTAVANVDSRGSLNPTRTSLSSPAGIVVEPATGALYVADSGNHRVLRFPRPVDQTGRVTPDAVIGQVDFTSSVSAVVSASSLRSPGALAFGPDGDLFVADTGNNRVLEFPAASGNPSTAVRVYGQPNFTSSSAPAQSSAQTLTAPQGVFVDSAFNLYVADTGANRVLVFPNTQAAPPAGTAAAFVIGQSRFDTTASAGGSTGLRAPGGIAVDHAGNIYVADSGNNRVLAFSSLVFLPIAGAGAAAFIGQRDSSGAAPNWDSPDGLATAEGLATPMSVYLDRQDTLYVADAGNSRVLHFLNAVTAVNAATYQQSVAVPQSGIVAMFSSRISSGSAVAPGAPWPPRWRCLPRTPAPAPRCSLPCAWLSAPRLAMCSIQVWPRVTSACGKSM